MAAFWPGLVLAGLLLTVMPGAAADVTTANYDRYRTNANLAETVLHTANVHRSEFGKLFSRSVDGFLYAQPLYVEGLPMRRGRRNVVFAATMHNTVYAFDADDPAAETPLWKVSLGPPLLTTVWPEFFDILPELGILSTPVIDRMTRTIYVVACTSVEGKAVYRLHALDLVTGNERSGSPVTLQAQVPGSARDGSGQVVTLDPHQHLQRPGLALHNGVLFIAFGAHADQEPYHGWLLAYHARRLTPVAALCTTPNSGAGAIWHGGRAPAVDDAGDIYIATGNGEFNGRTEFGNSVLRLRLRDGFRMESHFAPMNWQALNARDLDLGSSGPVLMPGTSLLVTGDKAGLMHLLDRDNLGGLQPGDRGQVQEWPATEHGIYGLAMWPRGEQTLVYVRGPAEPVQAWQLNGSRFLASPVSRGTPAVAYPFDGLALSANGQDPQSGILWQTMNDEGGSLGRGSLRAYDASDLSRELWHSEMVPQRDRLGRPAKYAAPTVANGKVYVPTFSNQLVVYGLLHGVPPGIRSIVNAASGAVGPLAPGLLITIRGAGFGVAEPQELTAEGGVYPSAAGGLRVLVDGRAAPLLYVSDTEIDAVVPFSTPAAGRAAVVVERDGVPLYRRDAAMAAQAPALFTLDGTGSGLVEATNPDGSLASEYNPMTADDTLILHATGLGLAEDSGEAEVVVTVDGRPAEVLFVRREAGPGMGRYEIGIRLPPLPPWVHCVVTLTVNGVLAQTNTTVLSW